MSKQRGRRQGGNQVLSGGSIGAERPGSTRALTWAWVWHAQGVAVKSVCGA